MDANTSFRNKLPSLLEHLYLKFVLFFQAIRHRILVREAHFFAENLAESVCPELQKIRQSRVTISLSEDGMISFPNETDKRVCDNGPQTKTLIMFLRHIGIQTLELDTLLEANQIVNALKVLFHAGRKLHQNHSFSPFQKAYSARSLAAILSSESGLNKFCANIRFDKQRGIFIIAYSYCELFYTFTVNTVLDRYTKTKNHQAIFSLAPKLGIFIGLLFLLHHVFWSPYSSGGLAAALGGALALGAGITFLTNTIASILYDQEHRDKLLRENLKEITALSHIPGHNPNPILKLGSDGTVLFANRAAENRAIMMNFSRQTIAEILPQNYLEIIQKCLDEQREIFDIEISKSGKTLRFNFSPFPGERAVLASGTDITRLKELEIELRRLNADLEKKVIDRTRELASTQDITILSLSSLAETLDPETGAHIQRTRLYVKKLAEHLRLNPRYRTDLPSDQFIDLLYRSAPLHDIGKVGIPDAILLKPGKLTEEEFEIMKRHAIMGGDSLKWAADKLGENSFLQLAREIAYGHHEKWDGSGYPYGLAAEQIPLSCRLMALADVYDALVNKRVYKEAFSHEKAKGMILQRKGTHFAPDVVDAFIALEQKFIAIANTYKDNV
jgi:HD-GYP domain-containing protein (c-di-GMP phosphodiesterase class II)